jgi:hypothetical protein
VSGRLVLILTDEISALELAAYFLKRISRVVVSDYLSALLHVAVSSHQVRTFGLSECWQMDVAGRVF